MMEREAQASPAQLKGFESLMEQFEATSQSLERTYHQLQGRVKDLQTELEQEREHRIQLERLAAMGEMAMELAHEIRNPLGSIELYASMIDGPYAAQIVRSVRLLNHSVTNVLQFGQPIQPTRNPLSVSELVEGVDTFLSPLAAQKDIRIVTDIEDDGTAQGDFELLHRMMLNLVLNALREIPGGGTIQLLAAVRSGEVRLAVADNGPGIPSGTLAKIFDPMFSTSKTGCGLGLSIVKRIVESHGGKIHVRSNRTGTRFDIVLGGAEAGAADAPRAPLRYRAGRRGGGCARRTPAPRGRRSADGCLTSRR